MFRIQFAEDVADDLKTISAKDRTVILDRIDEQLMHQPIKTTRNKKVLPGLEPPWQGDEVVWELRVGKFRVFYDVSEDKRLVVVRAIRKKPPHRTTKEIL